MAIVAIDIGHPRWRLNLIPDAVSPVVIDAIGSIKVVGAVVEVIRRIIEVAWTVVKVVQAILKIVGTVVKVKGLLRISTTAGNQH